MATQLAQTSQEHSDVDVFTSTLPFIDRPADCIVIACSDHRFRVQIDELIEYLGFKVPHFIKFPAGPVLAHPLVASMGFLTKAVDALLEKAIEAAGVKHVICITHEGCSAYRSGKLLGIVTNQLTGKSMRDLQEQHLRKTASRLERAFRGIDVKAFIAEVENDNAVHFHNIAVD